MGKVLEEMMKNIEKNKNNQRELALSTKEDSRIERMEKLGEELYYKSLFVLEKYDKKGKN